MFHRLNGVASRGTRGPAAAPALAKTDVRGARVAAIVVSVASTWLTLSSVRLLFDPGLEVLPADGICSRTSDGGAQPALVVAPKGPCPGS